MKAVKINKIEWNLDSLSEEERVKVTDTLPVAKGFMVDDNFVVVDRVPHILKKKYGYDIKTFAFTEYRVAETVEDLLDICRPKEKKDKDIFTSSGTLSSIGKKCKENLGAIVKQRLQLERNGVSAYDMPKIMDEVILGVEKITGLKWEEHTPEEILTPIYRKIWDMKAVNLKDEFEDDGE